MTIPHSGHDDGPVDDAMIDDNATQGDEGLQDRGVLASDDDLLDGVHEENIVVPGDSEVTEDDLSVPESEPVVDYDGDVSDLPVVEDAPDVRQEPDSYGLISRPATRSVEEQEREDSINERTSAPSSASRGSYQPHPVGFHDADKLLNDGYHDAAERSGSSARFMVTLLSIVATVAILVGVVVAAVVGWQSDRSKTVGFSVESTAPISSVTVVTDKGSETFVPPVEDTLGGLGGFRYVDDVQVPLGSGVSVAVESRDVIMGAPVVSCSVGHGGEQGVSVGGGETSCSIPGHWWESFRLVGR